MHQGKSLFKTKLRVLIVRNIFHIKNIIFCYIIRHSENNIHYLKSFGCQRITIFEKEPFLVQNPLTAKKIASGPINFFILLWNFITINLL